MMPFSKELASTLLILMSASTFGSTPKLPLFFFGNENESKTGFSFMLESQGLRAAFRNDSVIFSKPGAETIVRFVGANRNAAVEPVGIANGAVNFLVGPREQWRTGISTYSRIACRGLYRGIDLHYSGADGQLKSEFVVSAGADP